jgi:VanZ family protein
MKLSKKLNMLIGTYLNALNGHLRQAAHVVLFAILTILSSLTLHEAGMRWIYAVGFCIIWARVDEFKKRWFIGRHDGDTRRTLVTGTMSKE